MAQDVSARIEALKKKAAAAQQQRSHAEQAHAVALDRERQAREAMQQEFGVSTREEAAALLAQLEGDLARQVSTAEALLGKAEAE